MKRFSKGQLSAFTLVEMALACTIAMILMFGALYSSSEGYAVVREGDSRVHTSLRARRTLDRFLRDCRFAENLEIQGNAKQGWEITVQTHGPPNPNILIYTWSPKKGLLKISDGKTIQTALAGLVSFDLSWQSLAGESGPEVQQVTAKWVVTVDHGLEAGFVPSSATLALGGSTRPY